ncbi:RNA polymerase sigma-70 factor [uncultured Parabacteroides sp.]|uniref:RNA polymerase sigma-70 factor n=1 Tax=uncultured Parabacteroides sp. TaxID=512312 RepID=UPI00261FA555|nr:RNA polymerase sigma-70 factor [uncultured Parabacteroides sp.]
MLKNIQREKQNIMKVPEEYSLKKRHDRANDLSLFRELFEAYFKISVTYAYRFVGDWQAAEDITQDVFMSLWEKKENIDFNDPIKPYLYRAVYNRSINYLNSALMQKRIEGIDTIDELINQEILGYNQHDTLLLKEITDEINRFVDTLPPQCRTVYKLSREKNLRNKEIAAQLEISEKAVEKHISKALSEIRNHLVRLDILSILACLIGNSSCQ